MQKKSTFYVMLNHPLLPAQKDEIAAMQMDIVLLPSRLQQLWAQIDIPVSTHIAPLLAYLEAHVVQGDVVLVQGHAGATYLVVECVKSLGAKAVYAHSPRDSSDDTPQSNNSSRNSRNFKHLNFWEYGV